MAKRKRIFSLKGLSFEESNLINAALNDRIEKAIAILEDKADVAGMLRVLKGEADAVQYKKNTPDYWKNEVITNSYLLKKKFRKRKCRLMIPSSHDITREHLEMKSLSSQNLTLTV